MRICPKCRNKRRSESDTVTMHLCDDCFASIKEANAGNDRTLVQTISGIYASVGLPHAGALKNKIKEGAKVGK